MKVTEEITLQETREWLIERAHEKFGNIPDSVIADHILSITQEADFPVRRAAFEAFQRRMSNVENELLFVSEAPSGQTLGQYSVSRRAEPDGVIRSKKSSEARPYETWLQGLSPMRGQCTCPDYLKGSLGICKHLLTVLNYLYEPKSKKKLLTDTDQIPFSQVDLPRISWDPLIPLAGTADPLLGLHLFEPDSQKQQHKGFLPDGSANPSVFQDLEQRELFLRRVKNASAAGRQSKPSVFLEPAAAAVIDQEHERAQRLIASKKEAAIALKWVSSLKRTLYPYQLSGISNFLAAGRLLLADDMGLGKTTQAIAACHCLFKAGLIRTGVIIAPASLKSQWLREWQAVSDVPVVVAEGSGLDRLAIYGKIQEGFVICNYEQLLKDFEPISALSRELVVLDEAQRIKNFATKSAVYVKALPAKRRLALTGTPLENKLDELASILDFIDERSLAPKWRLPAWYLQYEGDGLKGKVGARNLDNLRERIAPVLTRRVRQDVLDQLPKRTDTRIPVRMTQEQSTEHDLLSPSIVQLMNKAEHRGLTQAEFLKLMQLLTTQRIISNGLGQLYFEDNWPELKDKKPTAALIEKLFSPKLLEFRNLIDVLVNQQQRKVVVFSQWRRMLKLSEWAVSDILAKSNKRSAYFTGAESSKIRTQNLIEFHDDPSVSVMFLSDAGGIGLNLQRAANACVNLELPWNPAVLEQRIGRIYRIGQDKPIDVFNLVSEPCIETRIADLVGIKHALFKGIFDGTSDTVSFEGAAGFLAQVKQLIDLEVPQAPEVSTDDPSTADAPPEDHHTEIIEELSMLPASVEPDVFSALPPSVEERPAIAAPSNEQINITAVHAVSEKPGGALPTASATPAAERSDEPHREQSNGVPVQNPSQNVRPTPIEHMLGSLHVKRSDDGSLTIHAPKEAANTLAMLFETMGRLMRESSQ